MYGDDLLVAPVTEPGVETWTLYLPGSAQVKMLIGIIYYFDHLSEWTATSNKKSLA